MGVFLVFGTKHLGAKPSAFRNDYCRSCDDYVISIRKRSFLVGHLFWIPILPLGKRHRWICWECDNVAHEAPDTGRPMKWFVVLFLLGLTWAGWSEPIPTESPWITWVLRFVFPAGALGFAIAAIRQKPWPDWKEKMKYVEPLTDLECPFCDEYLMLQPGGAFCQKCGLDRQ